MINQAGRVKMSKKLLFITIFLSAVSIFAQETPQPSPTPVNLETFLAEAEKQTALYKENFNNLLAEETKIFDDYDKRGKIDKRRRIESNFLVYQSVKIPGKAVEYRNVVKVDGKPVGNIESRAREFFEQVLSSETAEKELERIEKESTRFDKNLEISGLTLNQAPVLAEHIRPVLDFKLVGEDTIEGREVFIFSYRQTISSPYIVFNDSKAQPDKLFIAYEYDMPGSLKEARVFLRGKLWIDRETFQVLREQRELALQPENQPEPVNLIETNFEYQISDLGVLTPKKITLTDYKIKVKNKGKDISVVKDNQATFEYSKFTKSNVEVKSGEVDASTIKEN